MVRVLWSNLHTRLCTDVPFIWIIRHTNYWGGFPFNTVRNLWTTHINTHKYSRSYIGIVRKTCIHTRYAQRFVTRTEFSACCFKFGTAVRIYFYLISLKDIPIFHLVLKECIKFSEGQWRIYIKILKQSLEAYLETKAAMCQAQG